MAYFPSFWFFISIIIIIIIFPAFFGPTLMWSRWCALIICFGVWGGQADGWLSKSQATVCVKSAVKWCAALRLIVRWIEADSKKSKTSLRSCQPTFHSRAERNRRWRPPPPTLTLIFCRSERVLMLSEQSDVPARRFLSALISKLPFTVRRPTDVERRRTNTHTQRPGNSANWGEYGEVKLATNSASLIINLK